MEDSKNGLKKEGKLKVESLIATTLREKETIITRLFKKTESLGILQICTNLFIMLLMG